MLLIERMPKDKSIIERAKLYFNISLGIFLFILFFQPFVIELEFNNKLVFIAGLSAITFLLLVTINLILPQLFPKTFDFKEWKNNPNVLVYSTILIVNTAAYVFYIRYVGNVQMSFFLIFKIALISFVPIAILKIYKEYKILLQQINFLTEENKKLANLSPDNKDNKNEEDIEETFFSDSKTEKLKVKLNEILFINSADNYVKIVFMEEGKLKNKLLRTTLKNIEEQLHIYTDFFRCHRTCIVNRKHVENLSRSYKGYRLTINNYNEEIPVSQQYIIKVKEAIGMT
ncbi:MAG: LytTR family transcriptional regulator [Chlorobi bacterium]|nr:LytTR family transcriptional regulator [Chlorobiota bacterium]